MSFAVRLTGFPLRGPPTPMIIPAHEEPGRAAYTGRSGGVKRRQALRMLLSRRPGSGWRWRSFRAGPRGRVDFDGDVAGAEGAAEGG